jgi:CRISPR/Cas system CSM-associated protein Csm2 small subunit
VPADREPLAALVAEVGGFHIRDRAMRHAQAEIERRLANDGRPDDVEVKRYLEAVRNYFSGFEREARERLGDVERRLAKVSQLQFNLAAERGVAVRRVEVTQGVLARALELARR